MDESLTPDELLKLLRAAYAGCDSALRREFERSLPLQDAIFDRWERAKLLGFGDGASIYNSAAVFGRVAVGAHTWIGPYTILDGSGGDLEIGAYCSISSGVQIYTHDTVMWALSGGALPRSVGAVRIGDCAYLGSQSIIAAGVIIGNRCVVAANSFVNSDVPPGTIVGGSPACPIGKVLGEGAHVRLEFGKDGS